MEVHLLCQHWCGFAVGTIMLFQVFACGKHSNLGAGTGALPLGSSSRLRCPAFTAGCCQGWLEDSKQLPGYRQFEKVFHRSSAAEYVKSRLPEVLKQHLQDYEKDKENSVLSYQTILEQQILSIDREMLEKLTVSYDEAGTTCLIALLSDKELTVANVGDSRGVLCDKDGNAIPLSHDHKPYQLKERKRIKRAGGFISFNGSWRVQGILAMSRSLGDYPLKNLNVVIPDPDILTFDLDKLQPEFMILASDGLWDAFSNEEAVRFIKERLDEPHFGAKSIVLQSFYRGCPDNITVMVVKFRNSSKTEEQ
ncbi:protein phosphatase 1L isoform X3 [Struthio camelus]|uniref:protein phosphatase 1L isoform X3 n=1 Tax=Struthio camelus TaxID=8801 RepID=UPI003603D710